MNPLRLIRLRLRSIFQREAVNRELEEELQLHIEMQTEQNIKAGMGPEEARRQAILQLGGLEGHKEESRRAKGFDLMGLRASWLDLKLGLRMMAKHPGLTVVGLLALTIATGLGAAFYQFSENMFDPRVPLPDADRLVIIDNRDLASGSYDFKGVHDFAIWRDEVRTVQDLGVVSVQEISATTDEGYSEPVDVGVMTPSVFRATGVRPFLGRYFVEEDARPDAPPVVVLGYRSWHRFFGGDPGVLGETLRVGTTQATVVGVMPERYGVPQNEDMWLPYHVSGVEHGPREGPNVRVIGRLAPGASIADARAEMEAIGARTAAEFPETHRQLRPVVRTYGNALVGDSDMLYAVYVIRFVFILLMLVMCVNVATLVFARTVGRQGEFAVRAALGASRKRIVLQLFIEALALTLIAAVIGLAAAQYGLRWGMELFWRVQEVTNPPFYFSDTLFLETILYVIVLAVAGAAMVGILPALKVTGKRVQPTLRQLSSGSPRLRFGGVWTVVIVLQVALSVAFLPMAMLRGQNALEDAERESGFAADSYLTAKVSYEAGVQTEALSDAEREAQEARIGALFEEVKRRVAAEPGVEAVTFASIVSGMNHGRWMVHIADHPASAPSDTAAGPMTRFLRVDPNYFEVMGAAMVSGRGFEESDVESDLTVVVNRSFVQEVMNGQDPVGQRIRYPKLDGDDGRRWYEVVGVVENPSMDGFGPGTHPAIYHPMRPGSTNTVQMYVVGGQQAQMLAPQVQSTINAIDPSLRVGSLKTVRELWAPVHQSVSFFAVMQALVAGIALLLSMAGIHALMAFTVAQRTREIGVRAALGARPLRIVGAIFSRAFLQLAIGIAIGSVIAIQILGEDLTAEGPGLLIAVVLTMLGVGLLACYFPARRALKIHPTEALKGG